jgi:hypothetical protein
MFEHHENRFDGEEFARVIHLKRQAIKAFKATASLSNVLDLFEKCEFNRYNLLDKLSNHLNPRIYSTPTIDLFAVESRHAEHQVRISKGLDTSRDRPLGSFKNENEVCQNCGMLFVPKSDYVTLCSDCTFSLLGPVRD